MRYVISELWDMILKLLIAPLTKYSQFRIMQLPPLHQEYITNKVISISSRQTITLPAACKLFVYGL